MGHALIDLFVAPSPGELGDECTLDDHCSGINHTLCRSGFCQCQRGYKRSMGKCPMKLIDEDCEDDVDCKVPGSHCDPSSKTCSCDLGRMSNVNHNYCIWRKVQDKCVLHEDCNASMKNSFCSSDYNICSCVIGNIPSVDLAKCHPHDDIGDIVKTVLYIVAISVLIITNIFLVMMFTKILRNLETQRDFYDHSKVGSQCTSNIDCYAAITNSHCHNASCDCNLGHYDDHNGTQCIRRVLNDTCTEATDCNSVIPEAICNDEDLCDCPLAYEWTEYWDACRKRVIGSFCQEDEECFSAVEFSHCDNRTSECDCTEAFMPNGNNTICLVRPTMPPFVQIPPDRGPTCNPNSSTDDCASYNDSRCLTIGLQSYCVCQPGYGRRSSQDPCVRVISYEASIVLNRINRKYDVGNLTFEDDLHDVTSKQFQELATRLELNGIATSLLSSDMRMTYIESHVMSFDPFLPWGIRVNAVINFEFNETALLHNINQTQSVFESFLSGSQGELGNSGMYVPESYTDHLLIEDLDECNSSRWMTLHNCDVEAVCLNFVGTFSCICHLEYKDISSNVIYPGRSCKARTVPSILLNLEYTFRSASCTNGVCETPWGMVLGALGSIFGLLFIMLVIEVVYRTREMSRIIDRTVLKCVLREEKVKLRRKTILSQKRRKENRGMKKSVSFTASTKVSGSVDALASIEGSAIIIIKYKLNVAYVNFLTETPDTNNSTGQGIDNLALDITDEILQAKDTPGEKRSSSSTEGGVDNLAIDITDET
ncbi:hypothetical protein CAPTEDRAFT_196568 [Capitella teleta]|uniref:EGF-like domain-containing protein n=1 Tax=Capitella teleta TaxID=283909 RepID=R7TNT9_CAPTE|nr:hypothetical protein CAPTEDRAFT_196568 [Capitella teleta]|eukprot:ELT95548.1 hypothetical protein CAPTEDRAFT_196568 [Capitella teleta]